MIEEEACRLRSFERRIELGMLALFLLVSRQSILMMVGQLYWSMCPWSLMSYGATEPVRYGEMCQLRSHCSMLQCAMGGRLVQEHAVHLEGANVQNVDEPFSEQLGTIFPWTRSPLTVC